MNKPECELIGKDGNIFNLIGIAGKVLEHAGMKEQAKEMTNRVLSSKSYDDALCIIMEYVEVV